MQFKVCFPCGEWRYAVEEKVTGADGQFPVVDDDAPLLLAAPEVGVDGGRWKVGLLSS